jgi:3-hydroxybutyryl-CoA dehydrogenase
MKIEDLRRVLVVGAGTMGREIGLQCAMHGYDVTIYDVAQEALDAATARQEAVLTDFVAEGRLAEGQKEATLARITATVDPEEAAAGADLLSESVPEKPALKGQVFAQFNELCPPRTVFTTNTSSFVPSMFAEASGRPARFAAFHFHHVVWVSNVVDIMPHPGTAQETVDLLHAFAWRIGQIPIVCRKENHGYVFNAMLNALNGAALTLVANGVASAQNVDRAWMGVMKMPIGPFGILDGVGLDTAWDITAHWAKALGDPQLQKNADLLKEYVDQGHLGTKSGKGFYTYPHPDYQRPGFLADAEPDAE